MFLSLSTRSLVSVGLLTLSIACTTTFIRYIFSKGKCKCQRQYVNRGYVLIIGSAPGIALETAMEVVKRRGRIILANKNLTEAVKMRRKIQRKFGATEGTILIQELDFASCASIKAFMVNIKRALGSTKIVAIVNTEELRDAPLEITADGFDKTFQTNYMGPFILIRNLHRLYDHPEFSIITLSSGEYSDCTLEEIARPLEDPSNEESYGNNAYQISKVCIALMSLIYWLHATCIDPTNVKLSDCYNPWRSLKEPHSGIEGVLHALFKPRESSFEDTKRRYSYISSICVGVLHEREYGTGHSVLLNSVNDLVVQPSLRRASAALKAAV